MLNINSLCKWVFFVSVELGVSIYLPIGAHGQWGSYFFLFWRQRTWWPILHTCTYVVGTCGEKRRTKKGYGSVTPSHRRLGLAWNMGRLRLDDEIPPLMVLFYIVRPSGHVHVPAQEREKSVNQRRSRLPPPLTQFVLGGDR